MFTSIYISFSLLIDDVLYGKGILTYAPLRNQAQVLFLKFHNFYRICPQLLKEVAFESEE